MAKTPYLVTIEVEIAIFAENEKSIYDHPELRQAIKDLTSLFSGDCITSITPLNRIPNGWDTDCLVYGADGDVSLKEALNWNADKFSKDK